MSSILGHLVRVLGWSEMLYHFLIFRRVRAAGGLGHLFSVQVGEQPCCLLGDLKMLGQRGAAQGMALRGGSSRARSPPPQAPLRP